MGDDISDSDRFQFKSRDSSFTILSDTQFYYLLSTKLVSVKQGYQYFDNLFNLKLLRIKIEIKINNSS